MSKMIFPGWDIFVSGPFNPGNVNLLPNFYKYCSLLLQAFDCSFPQCPSSFIYYLYGQLGVLVDQENHDQPTVFRPCTPSTDNPGLVRHYILGRGLTSIFVLFRCTNLQNKIVLHKPAFELCWIHFCLFPSLKTRSFFIWIQRQSFLEIRELTVKNYVNSGRCYQNFICNGSFNILINYNDISVLGKLASILILKNWDTDHIKTI